MARMLTQRKSHFKRLGPYHLIHDDPAPLAIRWAPSARPRNHNSLACTAEVTKIEKTFIVGTHGSVRRTNPTFHRTP